MNREPRWRILRRADPARLAAQAAQLAEDLKREDPAARQLLAEFHPNPPAAAALTLADARLCLARAHDFPDWDAFLRAVLLFNAICEDDAEAVQRQIDEHPDLLGERVNGLTSNWGPPLVCAAQVGAEQVFAALLLRDGQDLAWALDRAILKGRADMARALIARGATPEPGVVLGPCESLNVAGLEFLAEIGAPLTDAQGSALAPVALLLEGYHRDPPAKHACLQFFLAHGIEYPDTPAMAFHQGHVDRLKLFLEHRPDLLRQPFSYRDIYPLELGCHQDETLGLHGTPIAGGTLLHLCMDFDEEAIARWALEAGADANARCVPDPDGFNNHPPLHNAVVSQAALSGRERGGVLARLLLEHDADPGMKGTLRKGIRFIADESVYDYCDLTADEYGRQFHAGRWVNQPALELVAAARG
ncbi:MAG: hypothetical protein AAGA23_12385 [Pseudomonadota bacterium]